MKLGRCLANAGRIEGRHAWTAIGGRRKRCVGCGYTKAELRRKGLAEVPTPPQTPGTSR